MKQSNSYREQLFAIKQSKPTSLYEAVRSYIAGDFSKNNSLLVLAATKHFYKLHKKRGRK